MSREPEYRYQFVDADGVARRDGYVSLRLDHDVEVDEGDLRDLVQRPLSDEDVDLLLLVAAVSRADRVSTRHLGKGWARTLHVVMPVCDPGHWSEDAVVGSLVRCLDYLTGDRWHFEFTQRQTRDQRFQVRLFPEVIVRAVALSYSGGMDSYCAAAGLRVDPGETVLLVHTRSERRTETLVAATVAGATSKRVAVPLSNRGLEHAEGSYRTRTFLFLVVAAVAVRSGGGDRVVIGENGQGALGPSLAWYPGEHPYYSMHPKFTKLLGEFLYQAGRGVHRPRFEHPAVLRTKGEVLIGLRIEGRLGAWGATRSCSRSPRSMGGGAPTHCGLCGGCILRRLSLHTAGLGEFGSDVEGYAWGRLDASVMRDPRRGIELRGGDLDLAVHGVRDLAELAAFGDREEGDPDVENLVEDVAFGLGRPVDDVRRAVARFLSAHRAEWMSAVASLPADAWLRRVAEGRA